MGIKNTLFILAIFFFNSNFLIIAQQKGALDKKKNIVYRKKLTRLPNTEAKHAIEIQDSIAGPFNVSLGYVRIKETKSTSGYIVSDKDYSAWFRFRITHDTILSFDIIPADSLDDYDFTLYKCLAINCIDSNGRGDFTLVRQCRSKCTSKSGMTGLSQYANSISVGRGPGPAYVSSINAKKGDVFYLRVTYGQEYINSRPNPSDFKIFFFNSFPKRIPITLSNIFFKTNKAILTEESFPELDKLAATLRVSQMVIEIGGHTDNQGDEKKNIQLSEERAKAVVDYLVSRQINKNRLFYKGFGSSKPIAPNSTNEGRQKNRRVEFVKVMY